MIIENIKKTLFLRTLSVLSITVLISANCHAQLTVNPTANPSGICVGSTVQLDAGISGGTGPYLFDWTSNPVGFVSGSASPTDNPSVTTTYFVNVTDLGTPAIVSGQITVNVNPLLSVSVTIAASSNNVCAGTLVTFTASTVNGGTSPMYQWKVNGANQGSNSSTFSYVPLNNDAVTCELTSNAICPEINPVTSNTITMTVDPVLSVSVSISASANNVCVGTSVTFTATPVNGGGTPAYQWKVNGINEGTNSSTYSYTPVNNDIVTCTLTSNAKCTTGNPATSLPITMIVNSPVTPGVSIAASPTGPICAGTSVRFTATPVDGGTPSYQWKVNGSNAGTNSSVFTSATLNNNDAVTVTMTSSLSCVTSSIANSNTINMAVNPLPVPTISSSVAGNSFCAGTSVTFTASGGTNYDFMVGAVSVQNGIEATYTTTTLTNGQVVSVIVTNSTGCSAASSGITNTVHPLPTATISSSATNNTSCLGASITFTASGGISYDFRVSGTSVQNSALSTYTTSALADGQVVDVIVTNSSGCSATSAGITNTVVPVPVPTLTSSAANNTFCAGTSVTFTASGGTNYNFRVGSISVQNSALTTYTTTSLTNGQVVDVVVSNAGGCSATSAGIINTVNQQPVSHAGSGGNVCSLSFRFNAVPSIGIGTWSKTTGPGTASFSPNSNTANATVTVSEYGTYTFTWTEVSGQCSSSSIVTVNFYLLPIVNAGIGGNNCGLGFHLNGTMNAGTGTWAKVSGPGNVTFSPNSSTPNAVVTVTAFGSYTFSWTVLNGTCSNSANVNVVFVRDIAADGGAGGDVCGEVFVLKATAPANGAGTWSKFSGPGNAVFTADVHQPGATVTVDKFGIYEFAWTISSGTCSSADMVTVTFHDKPLINAGRDTAVCKRGSIQLEAAGVGTVSWNQVQFLSNPHIINPIATPDTTTSFIVNLVDQFGCKNADSVIVEVRNNVVADAGPDQLLNYVFTTHLAAKLSYSYEHGIWSIVSGTGEFTDSTVANTVISGLSLGITRLLWTVTNGVCPPSSDSANIVIEHFVIPTMITPNMDGRNDYFILSGVTSQDKTGLVIFDRRGVQVYKNSDYDNSWNGVDYNNNPLPDDTYFYIVKYANGTSYKGYIVIRR